MKFTNFRYKCSSPFLLPYPSCELMAEISTEYPHLKATYKPTADRTNQEQVTNYMQHSPYLEANGYLASQEIACLLWKLKVYRHVHKVLPLFPVLSQMNPFHTLATYFPNIHFNIILVSVPVSSKLSLPFRFSNQNMCKSPIFHAYYMPNPSHPP